MLKFSDYRKDEPPSKKSAPSPKVLPNPNHVSKLDESTQNSNWPTKGAPLGKGSAGTIYLSHYPVNVKTAKPVVIKAFNVNPNAQLAPYRREVSIIDAIPKHPNITHYIAKNQALRELILPLASKGSLDAVIKQHKSHNETIPASVALRYAYGVACGLSFLHSTHVMIVHNDIKPDNILIFDEDARITDFDLAEKVENKNHFYSISRGSPVYMPPEKLLGEKTTDVFKSHIYSLAMSCWEMATGLELFPSITNKGMLNQRVGRGGMRPDLNRVAGDYPCTFPNLLQGMWAASPESRLSAIDVMNYLDIINKDEIQRLEDIRQAKNTKSNAIVHKHCDFQQSIPSDMFSYVSLKTLVLVNCAISALPPAFLGLKELEILNISDNQITHLPGDINELTKLKWLHCGNNKLKTLPHTIGLCSALTLLILVNNPIETLPPSLHALSLKAFESINGDAIYQLHARNQDILEIGVILMRYLQQQAADTSQVIDENHSLVNEPFDEETTKLPKVFYDNLRKLFANSTSQVSSAQTLAECLTSPNPVFVKRLFT